MPQIIREINIGYFEASKTAILTICSALHIEFLDIFGIFKCEISKKSKFTAYKIVTMTVFDALTLAKIDFT